MYFVYATEQIQYLAVLDGVLFACLTSVHPETVSGLKPALLFGTYSRLEFSPAFGGTADRLRVKAKDEFPDGN